MGWALSAEAHPLPVPPEYHGRHRIPNVNFPKPTNTRAEQIQLTSRLGQNARAEDLEKPALRIFITQSLAQM
jgi:hypothetical protein